MLWLDRVNFFKRGRLERLVFISAIVPGVGFSRWWPKLVWPSVALASLLMAICIVWIGRSPANLAFPVLVSLHVTSFLFAIEPYMAQRSLLGRALFSVGITICFISLVYVPSRKFLETHVVAPFRYQNSVVIMRPSVGDVRTLLPGDLVTFEMEEGAGQNVQLHEGLSLGFVAGIPGDRIRFDKGFYYRNGLPQKSLARMPGSGALALGKKEWFVWPEIATRGEHNAAAETISDVLLQQSIVTENRLKGRIYRRWFWWRQT